MIKEEILIGNHDEGLRTADRLMRARIGELSSR
jgi:hypothetical protein